MQTPWGDLAVADAHCHFFGRRFFASLAAQRGQSVEQIAESLGWVPPPEDPRELGRAWAAELDRHGVSRAALIASIPGDEASVIAAAEAAPGRFFPYAMVDIAQSSGVPAGLRALCFFPAMQRYSMHDERVARLLDEAATLPHPPAIFVHCGVLTVGVRRKLGLPSPFDMRFSNPLDVHAIALRYPGLRFVVPHFGAGYFREVLMLADLCPNVYLDTSSTNSWMRYECLDLATVLRRALEVAGSRRLLFGTDSSFFPRGWNRAIFETQVDALERLGIGGTDARQILGDNLIALHAPKK